MNATITIGYKADGTSAILAMPEVPYGEQRELFRSLTSQDGYASIEMWSRAQGRIRSRTFRKKPSKETKQ